MSKISTINLITNDVCIGGMKKTLTLSTQEQRKKETNMETNSQPKDFAEALKLELQKGLPVDEAIREAGRKHPQLLAEYENELLVR